MFTECTQLFRIIKNVESVRSPHMFLLSTLYPTFYCGSGWAKARLFLFFFALFARDRGYPIPPIYKIRFRRNRILIPPDAPQGR